MTIKPCAVFPLAICLAACSLPFPGATPVVRTASTIRDTGAVTPRDGAGAILIARDKQLKGMSCVHEVSLDDQPVAELSNGEQVTLYADPGDRVVTIRVRPGEKCEEKFARFPLLVTARATTRVRVQTDSYYGLKVEATTY